MRDFNLTPEQFIEFLREECARKSAKPQDSLLLFSDELAAIKAYEHIRDYIEVYQKQFAFIPTSTEGISHEKH